ncbi:MAG TPA: 4Fe-4S dicluster domain-containing protein [Candidatus Kapabacteria bacterium]|nr:4Fe-4S dicluster domain-containing protein [Candidatus Kapabacteria bacterium]
MDKNKLWRSLKQYNDDASASERSKHEFKKGVTDDFTVATMPDKSRRNFIAAMGATTALLSTACSDYYDKGQIITYNKKPDSVTYGKANYYASSMNNGSAVLVKTREGRPIKIDGNPEHPVFKGKIDAAAQASILDLYDPGRVRFSAKKSDSKLVLFKNDLPYVEWEKLDKEVQEKLNAANAAGKEIALITGKVISPTQKKLFDDFAVKYPTFKVYSLELLNDIAKRKAFQATYGMNILPAIRYDKADVIIALENDFLGADGNTAEQIRQFTSRRNVDDHKNFSRLYAVEGDYSTTGANADYRLKLNPVNQVDFIFSLLNIMVNKNGFVLPTGVASYVNLSNYNLEQLATKNNWKKEAVAELLNDIATKKNKVLFTAGNNMPYEVHLAVNLINATLSNWELFDFDNADVLQMNYTSVDEWKNLIANMNSGKVDVVIHFDANPVFHLAEDLKYKEAVQKIPSLISMVEMPNESVLNSKYIIAINNQYESWGDFKLRTGLISLQQPIIAPLHDTRQKEAVLLNWLQADVAQFSQDIYHKYLQENIKTNLFPTLNQGLDFNSFWFGALEDGLIIYKEPITPDTMFRAESFNGANFKYSDEGVTVILKPAFYLRDGKQANNGWLQELPHPVTKVTWDNYVALSPATAKKYDLKFAEDNEDKVTDMVEVNVQGRKIKLPILIQPGIVDNVISIELGYGRTLIGDVGNNVGANANSLMSSNGSFGDKIYTNCSITKTGEKFDLISTQEHHALDDEFVKDMHRSRHIIQEYTIPFYANFEEKYYKVKDELKEKYKDDPKKFKDELSKEKSHLLGQHHYEIKSIYKKIEYTGVKWAMAIDMNKCTGCSICVAACNVENNIPVVGKDQVERGREMQWMRIDTYFSGTPEEPITSLQPMLCQHCDTAPCESVCPVAATSHSPDGLNQMTYNRCVGTRYCSNNCPYKVRRYNFFDFRNDFADGYYRKDTLELLNNPEVTVRSRGVMEKCTFCVQRIQEARQDAIKLGRDVQGTDVKTACQEACPSSAISFGDMNDPASDISAYREHPLAYYVLETLNTKPNVTYIAKVKNINAQEEAHFEHH